MSVAERGMSEFMAQEMARREAIVTALSTPLTQALQEVGTEETHRGLMVGFHAAFRYALEQPWYQTGYRVPNAVQSALLGFSHDARTRKRYAHRADVAALGPIQNPEDYEEFTRGVAETAAEVTDHEVAMLMFADKVKYKPGAELTYTTVRDGLVDAIRMYIGNTYETAHFDPIP